MQAREVKLKWEHVKTQEVFVEHAVYVRIVNHWLATKNLKVQRIVFIKVLLYLRAKKKLSTNVLTTDKWQR